MKALCFSGHRPERLPFGKDEEDPGCIHLKEILNEMLEERIAEGYDQFYFGGAQGIDRICAELVLDARRRHPGIRLTGVIPYEHFTLRWRDADARRYYEIMRQADEEVLISRHYTRGCFFMRNRYMVEHSDALIAVYDGQENGGTAMTVRYAKEQGLRIDIVNPQTVRTHLIAFKK